MPLPDDTREFIPGHVFRDGDETTKYWIKDGKVFWRHYPIRGADVASFRFYLSGFAKDRKHCYNQNSRMKIANPSAFRTLNYAYATDDEFVWVMGGMINECDAKTFVVCDDGYRCIGIGARLPYGFGKDSKRVFFFGYEGKAKWVRKANATSFVSFNDGFFGKDEQSAFWGTSAISKSKAIHWKRIGGPFSKDDSRIFFANASIDEADYDSFEVVWADGIPLAKDNRRFFRDRTVVDEAEFREVLRNAKLEFDNRWLTSTVIDLSKAIRDELAFERLPILADALMDAGCDDLSILERCRFHERNRLGCWVVDLIFAKNSNYL